MDSFFWDNGGGGVSLFIWTMGGLFHMGEGSIRDFPGGTSVPISWPIGKRRTKSVEVNLTNCHREVYRMKSSVFHFWCLMALNLCDNLIKCYFDNLGHLFIHWVHYWSSKESQVFTEMLIPYQCNNFVDLVKSSFLFQVIYNTVL